MTARPNEPAAPPRVHSAQVAEFVALVGSRVRTARTMRGFSRRILSERSGVSQRYLAQLESGAGNISIALLYQIAAALGVQIRDLLLEDETFAAELDEFAELFRQASGHQRRSALEQLQPQAGGAKANRISGTAIAVATSVRDQTGHDGANHMSI